MKKFFVGFVLLCIVGASAAHAGKQPKWDKFYATYQAAVTKSGGNSAKIAKLNAIKRSVYHQMSSMSRGEFYALVDKKMDELKNVAK